MSSPTDGAVRQCAPRTPPRFELQPGGSTRRLTGVLAVLAALVVDIAIAEGAWRPLASLIRLAVLWVVIDRVQSAIDRWRPGRERFQGVALGLTGLAAGLVWVELLIRDSRGAGLPLELVLLILVRNMVVALAALAGHLRLQWLACGLSLFQVVFAASVTTERWAHGSMLVYVVVGSWWLMGRYWDGLRGHIASRTIRQTSWRWYLGLPLLLVSFAALAWRVSGQSLGPWQGAWGGSGGESRFDPNARGGVHDGDALVPATDTAASFGPVESEIFLDSETPSLYDVVNELYGDPPKPQKTEKAVALPSSLARESEQRVAESGDAGRQFSTVREPRQRPESLDDRDSPALFYVSGRTPLHLRLEVFDIFDGRRWLSEPASNVRPPLVVEPVAGKPWIRIPALASRGLVEGQETHLLKINQLSTHRIPTPWHPLGVHIDRVDRPEFFVWPQETVLGMDVERIPPSLVIHLQSRPLQPALLDRVDSIPAVAQDRYRLVGGDEGTGRIRELARQWTAGRPTGIAQIEAIVERLRAEYHVDPAAVVPEEAGNTVDHFLNTSRRGPDYLFASSAAVLLRTLGYSTRLVQGFYASPDRYDPRKRVTPVQTRDLHVWAEVYVGSHTWLEIEPTPGYERLTAPPGLLARLAGGLARLGIWARTHWLGILGAALCAAAAWARRHFLGERLATLHWRLFPRREVRERIQQTQRLVELRRLWFGPSASAGDTLQRRLLRDAQRLGPDQQQVIRQFLACADWAAFGPGAPPPVPEESLPELCRQSAQILSPQLWGAHPSSHSIRWLSRVGRRPATVSPTGASS